MLGELLGVEGDGAARGRLAEERQASQHQSQQRELLTQRPGSDAELDHAETSPVARSHAAF